MPTPSTRHDAPSPTGQRGSIAIYLALALVAFGVLAMAGLGRFSSVVSSVLAPNCATSARYMAESGMRYAMARLRAANDNATLTSEASAINSHGDYVVDASKGLSFALVINYNSASYSATVTSTGKSCANITASTSALTATVNLPKLKDVVDFSDLTDDFFRPTDLKGSDAITVDSAARTISFGKLAEGRNAAAIWYSGNGTIGCVDGNCTMTNGFNAYFDVQWNSASVADGLVFGIMSGETNTVNALGGDPNMGELMGWGGPGVSGYGLRPPKIGVELDTWYNDCNSNLYAAGSRCDPNSSTNLDHLAYVFWGSNTGASKITAGTYGSGNFYDDNRHGAGAGNASEPVSSNDPDDNGNGLFGSYYKGTSNWLRGGTKYYFRHELTRLTTASSGGTYCYLLKTWIISTTPSTAFKTVTTDYDATANPPAMQQVIFLNADNHAKLNKILFGWTEATGQYTQNITVGNFNLAFKKAQPTYGTAPSGATLYWPMYNNVGTSISDASGNGVTGTISGTARWVPGIMNNNGAALYFNGNTYVSAASNAATQLTTVGGVSLWFNMTSAQTGVWLLHKGETGRTSECYGLYIDSSGYLRFRLRYGTGNANYTEVISTTRPVAGAWYHVAVTWQNASTPLAIYVNGAKEASVAANTAQSTATNLYLGAGSASSTEFLGLIDEVYLYKQALTQANITALATGKP
jgi:hypothetical protein